MVTDYNKQLGSVAETIVTTELLKRGWVVSTPEGDYAPYDRIATKGPFTHKIQTKSATYKNRKLVFKWTVPGGHRKQRQASLDEISYYVFVAVPIPFFLIIPYDLIMEMKTVSITSHPVRIKDAKYYKYLNAWGLLENKGHKDVL